MLQDYELGNVRIGKVAKGDNVGKFFIMADARRHVEGKTSSGAARRSTGVKPISIQIWYDQDPELIDVVRSLYPATGTDSDGNPWNGSNTSINPAEFDVVATQKLLRNYEGIDWLTMDGCKPMEAQLGVEVPGKPTAGAFCRKYSRAMNGHAEGEWICGADGFVKVYRSVPILVRMIEDDGVSYQTGWEYSTQLNRAMRSLYSIETVIKEKPELVPSFYKEDDIVPAMNAGVAPEAGNDNR